LIPSDVDYEDVPSLIGSESSFNNDDDAEFPVLQPHFDIVTDNSSVFHRMHIGHNIGFFIILYILLAIRMKLLRIMMTNRNCCFLFLRCIFMLVWDDDVCGNHLFILPLCRCFMSSL
jgi:hypothetical protein